MEIRRLLELLPHRYPFLLIDRIIEVDSDRSGIGIKNVTINEPQFQGHFPDRPVMPGVLMIEGMAQTAGAMCVASRTQVGSPKVVYFMTVDKVKFRRPVGPGDVLQYRMKKTRNRSNMWWYSGEAWVGDTKVAEAELSAMLVDE
ncbi:3-hydroxyacyl-ACP dehydratase FabZ [Methylobrevis albus]|uniref:3-hydroxyacyl-[acyl-carrier-protein] dehydratase FabZ n=1 Tax=Methylobrevis albus TaxID=2793297 RepID=A0A931I3P6_9HYPH|nr:3-hydroxyacyl-ACP dehydratase FabZ [Methylobrevis albus]MBH0239670.1 3-hydroxyacyl-ACP dehydratase FabZ [Methylobrevis albus]